MPQDKSFSQKIAKITKTNPPMRKGQCLEQPLERRNGRILLIVTSKATHRRTACGQTGNLSNDRGPSLESPTLIPFVSLLPSVQILFVRFHRHSGHVFLKDGISL
jgi:hypothetical protein